MILTVMTSVWNMDDQTAAPPTQPASATVNKKPLLTVRLVLFSAGAALLAAILMFVPILNFIVGIPVIIPATYLTQLLRKLLDLDLHNIRNENIVTSIIIFVLYFILVFIVSLLYKAHKTGGRTQKTAIRASLIAIILILLFSAAVFVWVMFQVMGP